VRSAPSRTFVECSGRHLERFSTHLAWMLRSPTRLGLICSVEGSAVAWRLVKGVQVATVMVAPPWSTVLGHARPLSMSDRSATYTSTASVQPRMNPNRPQDRTVQCLASDPRVERGDEDSSLTDSRVYREIHSPMW